MKKEPYRFYIETSIIQLFKNGQSSSVKETWKLEMTHGLNALYPKSILKTFKQFRALSTKTLIALMTILKRIPYFPTER